MKTERIDGDQAHEPTPVYTVNIPILLKVPSTSLLHVGADLLSAHVYQCFPEAHLNGSRSMCFPSVILRVVTVATYTRSHSLLIPEL